MSQCVNRVMKCLALCCSVLQCDAACYSVLQRDSVSLFGRSLFVFAGLFCRSLFVSEGFFIFAGHEVRDIYHIYIDIYIYTYMSVYIY